MTRSKKRALYLITPMVVIAFSSIYLRNEVIRVAYDTAALQRQKQTLIRTQKDLNAELAQLSTLDRIERIALEQLGMSRPRSGQRINVSTVALANSGKQH